MCQVKKKKSSYHKKVIHKKVILAFFITLTEKQMETTSVFLQQSARNTVPKDTI